MASRGETILNYLINQYFNEEIIGEKIILKKNTRPPWLMRLELDFYLPQFNIAYEYQGEQHYAMGDFNGNTWEGLKKRVFYDKMKLKICEERGIALMQIGTFELKPRRFLRIMADKMKYAPAYEDKLLKCHQHFDETMTKEKTEWIRDFVEQMKADIKKYNGGRKGISAKNSGIKLAYLENLLSKKSMMKKYPRNKKG